MPDFKTIADVRRDNGAAIVRVCREFVLRCRQLQLFAEGVEAIDGSKFEAVNNRDFVYDAERAEYRCPAGERAVWRFRTVEHNLTLHKYWSSACPKCPLKAQCTPADYRRVARWEHEQVLDAMQARLDHMPQALRLRRQTAEQSFATLKAWMGSARFLTKTLPKARTERSLHVLASNMKRMLTIFGVQSLLQTTRA